MADSGGAMRLIPTHRHLVRFALEAVTPVSVAGGRPDPMYDTSLIRDANGLPTLPGPTIAGVLRHLHEDYYGQAETDALFGVETSGSSDGQASRLEVSFGCIQNAEGRAVEGLLDPRAPLDEILRLARADAPIRRDHVALDECGTAINHHKYERTSLPAGYRFSVELAMWSGVPTAAQVTGSAVDEGAATAREALARVVALFGVPYLRLGGAARRGFGRVTMTGPAAYAAFDLRQADQRARYGRIAASPIDVLEGFDRLDPAGLPSSGGNRDPVTARLRLTPRNLWRFGRGDWPEPLADGRTADDAPLLDKRIVWKDGRAAILGLPRGRREADRSVDAVVPASAVKGALRHRTDFHFRRITKAWAGGATPAAGCSEILFGEVKDNGKGYAGHVLIDDGSVTRALGRDDVHVLHNSLDRFTQGVRNQILFSEVALNGGEIELDMTVMRCDAEGRPLPAEAWRAFGLALSDLCSGRLALGAKAYGWCHGIVVWSDAAWANATVAAGGGR